MRQLETNPIQELRRILRDQYSISSIIKELLQNADDAHAKQLHIGWTAKWPSIVHPLLNSPAILVLNDGEFTPSNEDAIGKLDVGSKGTEQGAIGKFGLGMKSVFHLCEGFFFVASANQSAAKDGPIADLVTPWPTTGPHKDWAHLDSAKTILLDTIARWSHGCARWLCLVLPLRNLEQLRGTDPIMPGQFPSIEQFRRELTGTRFTELVPRASANSGLVGQLPNVCNLN